MNELLLIETLDPAYKKMLTIIQSNLPEIENASHNFLKSQSQFMDNMMTVSHITPIRNLRQILAQIEQTKQSLGEVYYKIEKKKLRVLEKREKLLLATGISRDLLELEIEELEYQISNTMRYVEGAIRKYTNYVIQYKAICQYHGISSFSELDFEQEEERYHICKAFQQAISAARSNGGWIDEGNQIYFEQIGINGSVAQSEVSAYLGLERDMLLKGSEPTHEMQVAFFLRMADKFKGCAQKYAEWKGQKGYPIQEAMNL